MSQVPDISHSNTPQSNDQGSDPIEEKMVRVLGFKEDWAIIPYSVLILIGFIVSIIDFVFVQRLVFQLVGVIIGIPLLVFGVVMQYLSLRNLVNVDMESIVKIQRLQIVEDQRLVTDGYYKYIRHPVYTLVELALPLDG